MVQGGDRESVTGAGFIFTPSTIYSQTSFILPDRVMVTQPFCIRAISVTNMAARKRRVITLDHKLKIIEDLEVGKSQRLVSNTYGVPKSVQTMKQTTLFSYINHPYS